MLVAMTVRYSNKKVQRTEVVRPALGNIDIKTTASTIIEIYHGTQTKYIV